MATPYTPTYTKQSSVSPSYASETSCDPTEISEVPAVGRCKEEGETEWTAWLPDSEENIREMEILEDGQYLGSENFIWELGMDSGVHDPEVAVTPIYTSETPVTP